MASTKQNRTISDFKGSLIGGGARPNLFEVELTTLPGGIAWDSAHFSYMCKAATLPASNVANIDVPFRGRIFKVAGDRTIDPWTVTIINDEGFKLRNAFEEWTDLIARLDNNMGATDPEGYMANAKVYQLGRGAKPNTSTNAGTANSVLNIYGSLFKAVTDSIAGVKNSKFGGQKKLREQLQTVTPTTDPYDLP